jgi:hypothetical protein
MAVIATFAMASLCTVSAAEYDNDGYVSEYEYVHEPISEERPCPAGTYYDACEPFEEECEYECEYACECEDYDCDCGDEESEEE